MHVVGLIGGWSRARVLSFTEYVLILLLLFFLLFVCVCVFVWWKEFKIVVVLLRKVQKVCAQTRARVCVVWFVIYTFNIYRRFSHLKNKLLNSLRSRFFFSSLSLSFDSLFNCYKRAIFFFVLDIYFFCFACCYFLITNILVLWISFSLYFFTAVNSNWIYDLKLIFSLCHRFFHLKEKNKKKNLIPEKNLERIKN